MHHCRSHFLCRFSDANDSLYASLPGHPPASAGTEGLLEYEPRLRAESVDLHTLKELEVDDLKHFDIPVGPARRIINVLRRHRTEDLPVVVRTMKTQVRKHWAAPAAIHTPSPLLPLPLGCH